MFAAAGVRTVVRETRCSGHASEMVAALGLEELRGLDGAWLKFA